MKFHSPHETEVKIRIPNIESTRTLLESLSFILETELQEEVSTLWDREGSLKAHDAALRLRIYKGRTSLTFKGPRIPHPEFKIRPESEVTVSDPIQMESILRNLGYQPVLSMIKQREIWRRPELVACIDLTPFGCFLEVEGEAPALKLALETLCTDPGRIEKRDYPTLYEAHR